MTTPAASLSDRFCSPKEVYRIGDEHPSWVIQTSDLTGDAEPIAIEVVALDDHITEIDPDAQFDAVVGSDEGVPFGDCLLNLDRTAHRIDDAGKFHQHAVAGGLDDPAMVLDDFRID